MWATCGARESNKKRNFIYDEFTAHHVRAVLLTGDHKIIYYRFLSKHVKK